MILRIVLLLAGSVLIGQAQTGHSSTVVGSKADSPARYERLRAFQFSPELWSIGVQADFGVRSTSYCVSRSLETGSLVFRRCKPQTEFA